MTSFRQHEKNFDNNPSRSIYYGAFWLLGFMIIFSTIAYGLGWFGEAATVAKEEFGARSSLKKYEWFKDASETLQEKKQTIAVYEQNLTELKAEYEGTPRTEWDRIDKQQFNQWNMEVAGLKASYNKVVKEYNSQSSKFNWSAYNTTELPEEYDLYLKK